MTNQAKVRAIYPHATIERQTTRDGKHYHLVRLNIDGGMDFFPFVTGATKPKAWRAAWEKIRGCTVPIHLDLKNK